MNEIQEDTKEIETERGGVQTHNCLFCCQKVNDLMRILLQKNNAIDKLYMQKTKEIMKREDCEIKNNILVSIMCAQFLASLICYLK